ncbi:MAG: lipopolysaccharide kinase InaA family protein [Gemmatimonadota bacterium]|nr:lipopolysaccharide kinase InaA family protein [Gemmatimonadota bacterium]
MLEPLDVSLSDGKIYHAYSLPGYESCELNGVSIVAREGLTGAFVSVLEQHRTLYEWAREEVQPVALKGRAPVYVASLPSQPRVDVAVRHSWHGGMLAPLTGDRFLRPGRAPSELLHSWRLRHYQIPTPELLSFALYRAGLFSVRVDVATRYVPHSHDLSVVLRGAAPGIDRTEALDAVQVLLIQLAAFGFSHRDLNVKNILLYHEPDHLTAAVLDVDVVQWSSAATPATTMRDNALRLARSMRKARRQFGLNISDGDVNDFVKRLLSATPPSALPTGSSKATTSSKR